MGEFGPTLEDVTALTCLPMFGDTNTSRVILNETSEKNLEALNMPILD